jgi:arginine/lysine/ornithine decarboxylase
MKKDQRRTPLFDAILDFVARAPAPFFIPSHKMGRGIDPRWLDFAGENIFKMDLSEVRGLDDLHRPRGPIAEAQALAADAWGADRSFFLVNGTSAGIIAAICGVVSEGRKIIVPRNAHKSVVFGLIVSGAIPVYVPAEIHAEKGLVGGISRKKLESIYAENADAKGVLAVSPSYHGICGDMRGLIEATHARGGAFIADEAHGNHAYFHEALGPGALALGADCACQSLHKMSGSLTQSSVLHIAGDRMDASRLEANLQMTQSTSPSYLLLASLDLARSRMALHGREILDRLLFLSEAARRELTALPGIEVLGEELIGEAEIAGYDPIRLVISARELGVEGYELYRLLRDDYNIEIEFGDYFHAVCVLGIGTAKEDVDRLILAMKDISRRFGGLRKPLVWDGSLPPAPPMLMTPRAAHFAERVRVPRREAVGRICAQTLAPYPPGIPVICPGEAITEDICDFLDAQIGKGRPLHGLDDGDPDGIAVVKE